MTDVATAPSDIELYEQLRGELETALWQNEALAESLAALELAQDDIGWARLAFDMEREFSRDGLDRIIAMCRLFTIKNPLIKRGVALKAQYVWGQGCEIRARDDKINELVVQPFLDDPGNQSALFSLNSSAEKDRTLTHDGNLFFALFPNPLTGKVKVRTVDTSEIRDIVCNPDDASEPWFYLRRWKERTWALDGPSAGIDRIACREAWYPDWRYTPPKGSQPPSIGRIQVRWESPIYHVKVGGLDGMRFGVPEVYAAIDWAKAYKLFLEDWATIVRSLSRFAWKMTVKRKPGAAAAKLGSTVTSSEPIERNPSPTTGAAFVAGDGADLTPIPKTGATVNSEDGVWLAKMAAAALGIPYTMLMCDPDMGNLATAKTLDKPTELTMEERQRIEAQIRRDLCSYAIDQAVRAPGGKLSGTVTLVDGLEVVTLGDETDRTIDVVFPPILEHDVKETVDAIVAAFGTDLPPAKVILQLLLQALGVEDIDEILAEFDEDEWQRRKLEAVAMLRPTDDPEGDAEDDPQDEGDGDQP